SCSRGFSPWGRVRRLQLTAHGWLVVRIRRRRRGRQWRSRWRWRWRPWRWRWPGRGLRLGTDNRADGGTAAVVRRRGCPKRCLPRGRVEGVVRGTRQLHCGVVAIIGVLGHAFGNDRVEARGQPGVSARRPWRRHLEMAGDLFLKAVAWERVLGSQR